MEADLGSNPSFVWCSLLQARELITAGSAWKIGDGQTVGIESHKWLPRPPWLKPGADRSLKVCHLFDAVTRQWNRPLIHSLFHASTRDDILRIKLGDARTRDKLHWIETKSRTFSVKSAYHVGLRLSNSVMGEHSLANQDKGLWNKVWSLNTPPKVRNFIWRACSDILPTRVNLQRRKVQVDPKCGLCGQQDETTNHVLWECPFARCTWSLVRGKIQKSNSIASCFHLLTRQMIGRLPKKELEVWAMISWSLWNAHNKFHFEQVRTHLAGIHHGAMAFLEEYQRHMAALQHAMKQFCVCVCVWCCVVYGAVVIVFEFNFGLAVVLSLVVASCDVVVLMSFGKIEFRFLFYLLTWPISKILRLRLRCRYHAIHISNLSLKSVVFTQHYSLYPMCQYKELVTWNSCSNHNGNTALCFHVKEDSFIDSRRVYIVIITCLVNAIINTKLLCLQEVPSVLNCRHREKGLLEGGVDPRIAAYITNAGLDGLLRVPNIDIDHTLITALVESWRPETHSFHLPHGEMTITLQDVEVIMGVLVVGLLMVGYTVMEGARVKAKWLEEWFINPLPADATEVLVQREDSEADWRCRAIGAVVGIGEVSTHMSCNEASTPGTAPKSTCYQFGMKQGIPDDIDTSIELHKITLQGKQDKNWVEEHAPHIAEWVTHARIADAPPFHGEMSYNDEYMVWFHPCTVRHITKATSYWDTLVESQLKIMAKFEPGFEIYTECINALQAVEELGRLILDDARTVGNSSVPTVKGGRQVGGRQGQGGRHQSSQCPTSGRRHTPVPTSSRRHTCA
ncbi:hypothetical protein SO802_022793 [Lithocarpus litseifolius]|uniref:Reverse transcriptase zinc-binding domain-containing protein n=1 Tax=Lithocarpus litseifolius TaxID=425828 RepID=A0AAW2C9Y6_9ROSI